MIRNLFIASLSIFIVVACKPGIDSETYKKYRDKGDGITNQAQATLLANVGAAIHEGGPQYAVEFCNLKASGIIDSLNLLYSCNISRVSDRNRNPNNNLKTKIDEEIWNIFLEQPLNDTLLVSGENYIYFKRINTAMPACLKCHGTPEKDIDRATLEKLSSLYPQDLATGYSLNDFRGLWRVAFEVD